MIVLAAPAAPVAGGCPAALTRPGPARGEDRTWRARLVGPTAYRRRPAGRVSGVLDPSSGSEAAMTWGMVVGVRATARACRVGVQLPSRPNGRVGWIDASRVRLSLTPWRVD